MPGQGARREENLAPALKLIARMKSDFPSKFGIPRQSGIVEQLRSTLVFEPEYRSAEALRGLEEFSHLWLIWGFSEAVKEGWSPTVRPPRLGGNKRMGIFSTRSPFRPNPIGLSCVELISIEHDRLLGPLIHVAGADLMDGTPIYDIKPYLPYADCHPEAVGGFASEAPQLLEVEIPEQLIALVEENRLEALIGVLAQDPRPPYQEDKERVYGMSFAGLEIKFTVSEARVTVISIEKS